MGDMKKIVQNHTSSLQQRDVALDLSQPSLGKYTLLDLTQPTFPFHQTNLSGIAWLRASCLFYNILGFILALCYLFRNFEWKTNLFHICLLRVFSHVCSEASQMSSEALFPIFRSLPP